MDTTTTANQVNKLLETMINEYSLAKKSLGVYPNLQEAGTRILSTIDAMTKLLAIVMKTQQIKHSSSLEECLTSAVEKISTYHELLIDLEIEHKMLAAVDVAQANRTLDKKLMN